MAKTLLIHLPHLDRDAASWCLIDTDGGELIDAGAGDLAAAAAAAAGQRTVVAIGSAWLTLCAAELPPGASKRAREALPFALEEQLASDVETLHFALGPPPKGEGNWPVAVIDRDQFSALRERLQAAGIQPQQIVPDALLLPMGNSDEWELLRSDGVCTIRRTRYEGLSVAEAAAPLILERLLDEAGVDGPTNLSCYTEPGLPALQTPDTVMSEEITVEHGAQALARGLGGPTINLLQGEFAANRGMAKMARPWRLPAAIGAGLIAIQVGAAALENGRLAERQQQQRAQMESLLKQAFPAVKQVRDPVARMRAEMNKLRQGGGEGELMPLVAALSAAIGKAPGTTINSINFRNGRADVNMVTENLQSLDRIKSELDATDGVAATIQSANQQSGGVNGRLRLEAS